VRALVPLNEEERILCIGLTACALSDRGTPAQSPRTASNGQM